MPSPFPGMDPYLEDPIEWPDTHHGLIGEIRKLLAVQVAPHYIVRVEQRVQIASPEDLRRQKVVPDVIVVEHPSPSEGRATATLISPASLVKPLYDPEIPTRYIEIRDMRGREVVTTIEILSPANKAADSSGRAQYLDKRRQVMLSNTHWIEIDLLRAGERPDEVTGLSDYYALLKRGDRLEPYDVWFINLRDQLPTIAVPLRPPHDDVPLNLQTALDNLYETANYAGATDYTGSVPPPQLLPADANWVAARIREWQQARANQA